MPREPLRLSAGQQAFLLALAREAIGAHLGAGAITSLPTEDAVLNRPGAAFVTLKRGGALRGCIGYTQAVKPLVETVVHCAVSAAIADPRFPPVTPAELPRLSVEISILSPFVAVQDIEEIRVGRDGLQVSHDGRRGLLLPQVATEFGWDRETFLRHTCRKAGLPPDAWCRGALLQRFTVTHFHEAREPAEA